MKVTYKKKPSPKRSYHNRNTVFRNGKQPKTQSAKSRTVVRVTAVPRRTVRGC